MKRRLRLCSQGELFYVVVQICDNFWGLMTRSFGEYSLPLAVVLFRMYLHDCVSCMMFKRYFVPIQPLGF